MAAEQPAMRKWWIWLWLCCTAWAQPQRHLVIVGGGEHPPAAMAQMHTWAGQDQARILVIPWSTAEPEENFKEFAKDFTGKPIAIEMAPLAPLDATKRQRLLSQLANCTGVWFSGGDQVKTMKVFEDRELLQAFRDKYAGGTVFGGTSAGTAIMSTRMLTGETDLTLLDGRQVETREGLGLLPSQVIVDQHFIKRQRQNRLFGLILLHPDSMGVGIDEDTALLVSDDIHAQVAGRSQVMVIHREGPDALRIVIYRPGDQFDL